MALLKAPMKSIFQATYSRFNPINVITATDVSTAITLYWLSGLHPTGGIVIPAASQPILLAGLIDAWKPFASDTVSMANKVADTIESALLAVIIAGGLFGFGGVKSANKGILVQRLLDAYLPFPSSGAEHGAKLADAIEAFTKTNEVFGTGVPPVSGPPSGAFI